MRKFAKFVLVTPFVLVAWAAATVATLFSILLMPIGVGFVSIIGAAGMYVGSLGLAIKFVRGTK